MAAPEHRAGAEFRVAGRVLSGTVLRYGDVAPQFRERFVPGAFGAELDVPALNLQHDPNVVLLASGSYVLNDGPRSLDVRAELPEGSAALELVRRGALTGFSIEFQAKSERREAGIRVIESAELTGLALVDRPAYLASKAEVRASVAHGGAGAPLARFWL